MVGAATYDELCSSINCLLNTSGYSTVIDAPQVFGAGLKGFVEHVANLSNSDAPARTSPRRRVGPMLT
jgi:hypothetical protein